MSLFDRPIGPETYAAIRFGVGLPMRDAALTPERMLQNLQGPDRAAKTFSRASFNDARELFQNFIATRKQSREGKEGAAAQVKALRKRNGDIRFHAFAIDIARGVATDDSLRERLAWFWANHFATQPKSFELKAGQSAYVDEAIRPNLTGRFADLLKAAITHPAMLLYLDQVGSVGPNSVIGRRDGRGLNENLARELMELHTLGVGAPYAQADVAQLAELLTGLHYSVTKGPSFNPLMAEPGAETVLGIGYGDDGLADVADIHAVLEDLAAHPATAAHICTKLATYFVADAPDPDLVAHMTGAYKLSGGQLIHVYAAMLEHPAAWRDFGAKVKLPQDFLVSGLRALGVRGEDIAELAQNRLRKTLFIPMRLMGQTFNSPPGPDGFAGDAATWVQPYGLAARIDWAMKTARTVQGGPPDPRAFVTTALGDAASGRLIWAAEAAETRAEGVGIILASAEFNRR